MKTVVIDATNATLGRLSSYAAKQSLLGKEVIILNSEKAIITGKKIGIVKTYKEKRSKGGTSMRGPNFPGTAERIVKRTIRGMLPNYRKGKGKEAFRRILCYKGIPEEYKNEKLIKAGKEKHTAYVLVEEVSKKI